MKKVHHFKEIVHKLEKITSICELFMHLRKKRKKQEKKKKREKHTENMKGISCMYKETEMWFVFTSEVVA